MKRLKSLSWSGATVVGGGFIAIVQLLLLLYLVAPSAFGQQALALLPVGLGQIVLSGLVVAFLQAGKIHQAAYQQVSQLLRQWAWWVLPGVLAGALFVAFLYRQPTVLVLSLIMLPGVLLGAWGALYKAVGSYRLDFRSLFFLEIRSQLLAFAVVILLAWLGWEAMALAVGWLTRQLLEVIQGHHWMRQRWKLEETTDNTPIDFISTARPQIQERVVTLLSGKADILTIGAVFGVQQLGWYEVLKRLLLTPAGMLSTAMERVAFPIWVRLWQSGKQPGMRLVRRSYYRLLLSLQVLVTAFLAVASLVVFCFPQDWIPADYRLALPLWWPFVIWVWCASLNNPTDTKLLVIGKIHWWRNIQIGIAVLTVLFFWLCPCLSTALLWLAALQLVIALVLVNIEQSALRSARSDAES